MLVITRREFFAKTGASAVAMSVLAAQVARIKAAVAPMALPLGSQTYPHRVRLGCDFPGLLKDMKALGLDAIELCSPSYGANDFGSVMIEEQVVSAKGNKFILNSAEFERLISGAALDVFEREPAVAEGLRALENVVLAPHIGSATRETRQAMADLAARIVAAVLAGEAPLTPVSPPRGGAQ
jgi:hypothetical protein